MKIISYNSNDKYNVAIFFREIFKESNWEETKSDYIDEPDLLFHLPNKGVLLLVKENNIIIGTAGIILINNNDGLIKRFYIKKENRGTGIAQKLLKKLIIEGKSLGIKKIILDVSKNNSHAIHFYEKSGFLPTKVIPQKNWPESYLSETHFYFYKPLEK